MNWLRSRFELAHSVRPLEGLRGFAVALVFLVHYVSLTGATSPIANALHTIGNSGVDLFFVLSGYLIYGSLIKRAQPYSRFMKRRIERIYPTWIAVFGAYLMLSFLLPAESKIPAGIDGWIYAVQNFLLLPGIFPIEPIVAVSWSLSYEFFFYVALPLVVGVAAMRTRTATWRVTLILLTAGVYGYVCVVYGGLPRLLMFAAGMVLYDARRAGVRGPDTFATLVILAGGLAAMLIDFGPLGTTGHVMALFVAFPLLCLTCFQAGTLENAFSWTPLRWLGNMSYSYYLIHGLSLKAAFMPLTGPFEGATFWLLMPLMFVWTLIPSAALFLLVERPFSLGAMRVPEGAAAVANKAY